MEDSFNSEDKSNGLEEKIPNQPKENDLIPTGGGYPVDSFLGKIDPEYICGVCREVIRNPPNLKCPHLFCLNCLERNPKKVCPTCRVPYPSTFESLSIINHKIRQLKIKCYHHEKGCVWTGIIGKEEAKIQDHLKECKWGGFIKCEKCAILYPAVKKEEHFLECKEEETECEYCGLKGKRKYIFVHKSLGEYKNGWCANRTKCAYKNCKGIIIVGKLHDHFDKECEHRHIVCRGCADVHVILQKDMADHIQEVLSKLDKEGRKKYLEMLFRKEKKLKVGEYLFDRNMLCKITAFTTSHYGPPECDILYHDSSLGRNHVNFNYINVDIQDFPENIIHSNQALTAIENHECSFHVTNNIYFNQPSYACDTCPSDSINSGETCCCAVCAIECHFGHELRMVQGENFCDCCEGSFRTKLGKPLSCRAPNKIINNGIVSGEIVLDFIIHGNDTVEIKLKLQNILDEEYKESQDLFEHLIGDVNTMRNSDQMEMEIDEEILPHIVIDENGTTYWASAVD